MEFKPVPQGPWFNPRLPETVYDAVIEGIREGEYGKQKNTYIQFIFWLPGPEVNVVTNIYLPKDKPDNRSVHRLLCLCRCVGRVPQDVLDDPRSFEDESLQITVKKMKGVRGNGGQKYHDVDLFLPTGSVEPVSSSKV